MREGPARDSNRNANGTDLRFAAYDVESRCLEGS